MVEEVIESVSCFMLQKAPGFCHANLRSQGPLTVKIFAPFETELGTWTSLQGAYVLRATAPPMTITTTQTRCAAMRLIRYLVALQPFHYTFES